MALGLPGPAAGGPVGRGAGSTAAGHAPGAVQVPGR